MCPWICSPSSASRMVWFNCITGLTIDDQRGKRGRTQLPGSDSEDGRRAHDHLFRRRNPCVHAWRIREVILRTPVVLFHAAHFGSARHGWSIIPANSRGHLRFGALSLAQRSLWRPSWLAHFMVAAPCPRRPIDVRTKSGLCRGNDLHDNSTAEADPGTVGSASAVAPVFANPLLLGQSPREEVA